MENMVVHFDGYLSSLRRFSKNKCFYWASQIDIDSTVANTVDNYLLTLEHIVEVTEIKDISAKDVVLLFNEFIFQYISNVDASVKSLLTDDIIEYYGLISTSINPDGEWNPLLKHGAKLVRPKSSRFQNQAVCFVPIGKILVITGFSVCA